MAVFLWWQRQRQDFMHYWGWIFFRGQYFPGVNIFQEWIFFSFPGVNIFQGDYFSGVNIYPGWIFSGVDIFQGWIFSGVNIFQGWLFFRGEYFSGATSFQGRIFSRVIIFNGWTFFSCEYFEIVDMNLVDTDVRHSGHSGYRGESFTGVTIFQRFMFIAQFFHLSFA